MEEVCTVCHGLSAKQFAKYGDRYSYWPYAPYWPCAPVNCTHCNNTGKEPEVADTLWGPVGVGCDVDIGGEG